jgi:hypothetical protein
MKAVQAESPSACVCLHKLNDCVTTTTTKQPLGWQQGVLLLSQHQMAQAVVVASCLPQAQTGMSSPCTIRATYLLCHMLL